jgi:hypothetical protein
LREPAAVVSWFGAMQAQEYVSAAWGIGLRLRSASTIETIGRAFDAGQVLRTHVMRPTWHFVTPSDIHWMLTLTAPRVHRILASTFRQFDLDAATSVKAAGMFERAVGDGAHVTRAALGEALRRGGVVATGVRLALLTIYAELEGVLCSGRREGKQLTYAALSARAPRSRSLSRDEAIGELTARYYRSHGPATIRDFVWWSGLTTADAKRGLDIVRAKSRAADGLTYWTVGGTHRSRRRGVVQLLPNYDEYLVAYRDLAAMPRPAGVRGILQRATIVDGAVIGTWSTSGKPATCVLTVSHDRRLTLEEKAGLEAAAEKYGRFHQMTLATNLASYRPTRSHTRTLS